MEFLAGLGFGACSVGRGFRGGDRDARRAAALVRMGLAADSQTFQYSTANIVMQKRSAGIP